MQNPQPQPLQPHAWYADQPGVYNHPAGAPVPEGFRLLNDGSGRVEKIATGAET